MTRNDIACHFTRYSSDKQLAAAQRAAQQTGLGFWSAGAQKPACAVGALREPVPSAAVGPFHGNTSSRVFHAPACRNYHCRNCTATFDTASEAVSAGYKPAADCLR